MSQSSPLSAPSALSPPRARAPEMITTADALARQCDAWRAAPALAVDTEFVRERTYFPGLGLIQVGDGTREYLIDVVAIEDLSAMGDLLTDDHVTKVFHACGEDLETLYDRFGAVPTPLFDTQIAAALAGHGAALSYRALAGLLCGVDIPKDETRTNWLRRPLTAAQIRYAALDVAYLLPLHDTLRAELASRDRLGWLTEDIARLGSVERFLPDPEAVFRRVKGSGRLRPSELAVLRAVAAWREKTARRRDQPRGFVVSDAALLQLARKPPRNEADLGRITELSQRARQRYGRAMLDAVREGQATPSSERPQQPPTPSDPSAARHLVKRLQAATRKVAETHGLPPEVLANRRTLAGVATRAQRGEDVMDSAKLRGWRGTLLADAIERTAAG